MPSPIQSGSTLDASIYYDEEEAVCRAPSAKQPASPAAPIACDADCREAVAELVKASQDRSCVIPIAEATATCGATVVGAVAGVATGPGELALLTLGGAACGIKVMSAIDCLER